MLVPLNVTIELSNVRKKIRKPSNVVKELSHVMLEPYNVRIKLSKKKKKKGGGGGGNHQI